MNDKTNYDNLKRLVLNTIAFVIVMIIVMACSVLFGMMQYSSVSNFYDKPQQSVGYHDHRVDISDSWNMDVLPRG